ncbi:nuclear apoptosis-inducing factor 1-like [Microcaecilia unicolor]|uniref:Nuclear apoptosis-inducing factor 1-like n=1 Tax=Microcaecilia unicolor TaxID=1415580 RepID=A0A6P7X4J6_9AMPH|nr:nuclear apoptosis-inducing factor 1-like [Microcaecilia unicolor]
MAPRLPPTRKGNFSDAEIELLVQEIDRRHTFLFAPTGQRLAATTKQREWQAVRDHLNAVFHSGRDVEDCKRKWRRLRRDVRRKAGGNSPAHDTTNLTPLERIVHRLLPQEGIHGIPGTLDTSAQPEGTGDDSHSDEAGPSGLQAQQRTAAAAAEEEEALPPLPSPPSLPSPAAAAAAEERIPAAAPPAAFADNEEDGERGSPPRQRLLSHRRQLMRVTTQLLHHNVELHEHRREKLQVQQEKLQVQREVLQVQREMLQVQREALQVQREALQVQREVVKGQHAMLQQLQQLEHSIKGLRRDLTPPTPAVLQHQELASTSSSGQQPAAKRRTLRSSASPATAAPPTRPAPILGPVARLEGRTTRWPDFERAAEEVGCRLHTQDTLRIRDFF